MLDIAGTDYFQMYLSVQELDELTILLGKADDEIRAQQLLECFDQKK